MYVNFWYPVCISTDLTDKPIHISMLKHDFVAFRDKNGKAAVLSDTCIHRGGALSGGKCKEDGTVQCPYHGWRFNTEGVVTRIPSLGINAKIPPRARVDSYPVQEKYGLVFAFLGDLPEAERPPIMPIDEYGTDGWRATVMSFDVDYNYERSIENGMDPAHNEYVHPTHGYSGERESEYKVHELEPSQVNPWGWGFMHTFDAPPLRHWLFRRARKVHGKLQAGSGTYGPNHMWTWIHLSEKFWMHQYMFEAPIEENKTRVFLVNMRNIFISKYDWLNRIYDKTVNKRNMMVAGQDIVVVNRLRPVLTPNSRTKELLMPHDKGVLHYRDKLDEFEGRGWKIDMDGVNAARAKGDVVYAIPSPARRQDKGWVLDPVPLVTPKQQMAQAAE
ncbi:MAG: aromatic ring-hydroxylating dioxygenase subunit alpha [Alphaproteobacteria bacterium]|nr:aromatic ring-hydroxylating dioxygenase subunit alpha [Alphaproteobacteria bacterium]